MMGMRYLMDVIGLTTRAWCVRLIGRPTDKPQDRPLFITTRTAGRRRLVPAAAVKQLLLDHMPGPRR